MEFKIEILAKNIKNARLNSGFTQEKAAESLNISRSAFARWELGTLKPSLTNLVKISNLFSVSTDWLLGISKENFTLVNDKELQNLDNLEKKLTKLLELISKTKGKESL